MTAPFALKKFPVASHTITQGNLSDPATLDNDHAAAGSIVRYSDGSQIKTSGRGVWSYDFIVAKGETVYAAAGGVVKSVGTATGLGKYVTIETSLDGGKKLEITYGDLGTVTVKVGNTVGAGEKLASIGGTHLHVQMGSALTNGIADGSHDSVAPAYFPSLTIHLESDLNRTDTFYHGTAGTDIIYANTNGDRLWGAGGDDRFIFPTIASFGSKNRATIMDFSHGDKIDLSGQDASTSSGTQHWIWRGSKALEGHGHAGELNFTHLADGSLLVQGDRDGNGTADVFLVVNGVTDLTASDFIF